MTAFGDSIAVVRGAYWLASQATEICLPDTAGCGPIGVYTVLHDLSEYFSEELLTKVHLVKAADCAAVAARSCRMTVGVPSHPVDALARRSVCQRFS